MSYLLFKRGNDLGGWIVFLIAAFVYGMTIEPIRGEKRCVSKFGRSENI